MAKIDNPLLFDGGRINLEKVSVKEKIGLKNRKDGYNGIFKRFGFMFFS
jgi:hypothetical protein